MGIHTIGRRGLDSSGSRYGQVVDFSEHGNKLVGCLTVHLPQEIKRNASLVQLGNFTDAFLARHVSGTYAHHEEH